MFARRKRHMPLHTHPYPHSSSHPREKQKQSAQCLDPNVHSKELIGILESSKAVSAIYLDLAAITALFALVEPPEAVSLSTDAMSIMSSWNMN